MNKKNMIYVVCCHWYGGCEICVFDNEEKAYNYMKNDFEKMLREYNYTQNDDEFLDDDGHDISNDVYITERTAAITAPEEYDSKLFWEIHCTDIK